MATVIASSTENDIQYNTTKNEVEISGSTGVPVWGFLL